MLLDARMPEMGGLALAEQVRQHPQLSATRIILPTSGDALVIPARARQLQIDVQLHKPVEQDELLETIYRVMRRTVATRCRRPGLPGKDNSPPRRLRPPRR